MAWWRRRADGARVGPREATRLLGSGALLLDVREPAEWEAGHVPGASHVPLGRLADHLHRVPRRQQVVVVCRSGHRSSRAAAFLVRSGVDAVNLDGGMLAWAALGLPVEADGGRPGTVL